MQLLKLYPLCFIRLLSSWKVVQFNQTTSGGRSFSLFLDNRYNIHDAIKSYHTGV